MRQENVIGGYIVELFRPKLDDRPRVHRSPRQGLRRGPCGVRAASSCVRFLPSDKTAAFGEPPLALSVQLTKAARATSNCRFTPTARPPRCGNRPCRTTCAGGGRPGCDAPSEPPEFSRRAVARALCRPAADAGDDTGISGHVLGAAAVPPPAQGASIPGRRHHRWRCGEHGDARALEERRRGPCAGRRARRTPRNIHRRARERRERAQPGPERQPRRHRLQVLRPRPFSRVASCARSTTRTSRNSSMCWTRRSRPRNAITTSASSISVSHSEAGPRVLRIRLAADRLDRIARANDVLFVVAAGNAKYPRPAWPEKPADALAMLAA